MLNKNTTVLIKDLLNSDVHLGSLNSKKNAKNNSYLLGIRNKFCIINLEYTLVMLRVVLPLISDVVSAKGQILFVGTREETRDYTKQVAKKSKQHFISHKWVGGTLTNWSEIKFFISRFKKQKIIIKKTSQKYKRFKNYFSGLQNMQTLPHLIVFLNPNENKQALNEAKILNIPTIGIIDSDTDPHLVNYPIIGNDDSLKAIHLYCSMFELAMENGIKKRKVNDKK